MQLGASQANQGTPPFWKDLIKVSPTWIPALCSLRCMTEATVRRSLFLLLRLSINEENIEIFDILIQARVEFHPPRPKFLIGSLIAER